MAKLAEDAMKTMNRGSRSQEGVALNHVALYVELMGRHSNLILVDDEGRIMESAKRVTSGHEPRAAGTPSPALYSAAAPRSARSAEHHTSRRRAASRNVTAGCRACARARQLLSRHQPGHGPRDRVPSHGIERDPRRRSERGERGVAGTRDTGVAGAFADNGLESAGLSRARSTPIRARSSRARRSS